MNITPSTIKSALFQVISNAEKNINDFVKCPNKDMTRHRNCCFSDTILSIMHFSMSKTSTELLEYFSAASKRVPTQSAFCQQRKKLNDKLFPYLLKSFNKIFPASKKYKGYTLMAVDGSDLNLPTNRKDTVYRIKQVRSDNYYYQMHLNALYNILDNRFHSISIQPRPKINEAEAFCQLVDDSDLDNKTIFIADRGYITLNTLAHLINNNKFFLIRAISPTSSGSFLRNIMEPNLEADETITLGVTRSRKKSNNNGQIIKCIKKTRHFEPIPIGDYESIYYMTLRVVCIKLDNGEYEYLVTNLPADEFPPSELKVLYHLRWKIETSFRSLKYAVALVYFHSVNREYIIQEIYAKIILYNFASILHSYAEKERCKCQKNDTKYNYKVSFDNVFPVARQLLTKRISNKIIKTLLLMHKTPKRQDVSHPRYVRSQSANPLNSRA
ncbi:MAG: IS4 family transposase [Lachnospiraceae bacterium]